LFLLKPSPGKFWGNSITNPLPSRIYWQFLVPTFSSHFHHPHKSFSIRNSPVKTRSRNLNFRMCQYLCNQTRTKQSSWS
jgi:hypothetical protein